MSFRDIKGHDRAIGFLRGSIEGGKVSHAYIFSGAEGIGKKLVALNFAKALNCLSDSGEKPCDGCSSCNRIGSSNHPDVFLVKPEKEGARVGIDSVRQVIKNISLKPYEARKKCYIIDSADFLTGEASNAFLKTLEEPPTDSVIIFISHKIRWMLPTIESRSQVIKFFPLGAEAVEEILVKNHSLDRTRAGMLSRISSGSVGIALRINDKKYFEKRASVLDGLADGSFFDADFEKTPRQEIRLYLDMILSWYRDVLVAKAAKGADGALINTDRADAIRKEACARDFSFLDNMIKQVILTRAFLDDNVNARLALAVLGANINEG